MSRLIKFSQGRFAEVEDCFTFAADDEPAPPGDVIVSLARFQREGEALASPVRQVGVRLTPDEAVEDLTADLARTPVVELWFARFRDGRPYTSARLLRERLGYRGEIRAVGDVLREQAQFMIRCGFDGFVPGDGSSAAQWADAAQRFRHVYQRASDLQPPLFEERARIAEAVSAGGGIGL